jgi:hypothetical protein
MEWLFGSFGYSIFTSEDFKKWSIGRHPSSNAFAYFEMVRERNHATRLEF